MRLALLQVVSVLAGMGLGTAVASAQSDSSSQRKPSWLPEKHRALFVCVVEDKVTLSWNSEKGYLYTILYTDKPQGDAVWLPLPGYVRMPGTGRTETLVFRIDPARPRRFNLRVEEASKVRKTSSNTVPGKVTAPDQRR